jgi:hypothetical protein
MADQNNVQALKRLCAKIIGGTTTAADITGTTIAEVLDEITKNFTGSVAPSLGVLTVSSVAGSTKGTTKITVSGASDGPKFKYKISESTITAPKRDEDLSTWTSWNGTSEITAADSTNIYVCEVDENNLALKGGSTSVTSKLS